jgi:hypothetical protein
VTAVTFLAAIGQSGGLARDEAARKVLDSARVVPADRGEEPARRRAAKALQIYVHTRYARARAGGEKLPVVEAHDGNAPRHDRHRQVRAKRWRDEAFYRHARSIVALSLKLNSYAS